MSDVLNEPYGDQITTTETAAAKNLHRNNLLRSTGVDETMNCGRDDTVLVSLLTDDEDIKAGLGSRSSSTLPGNRFATVVKPAT